MKIGYRCYSSNQNWTMSPPAIKSMKTKSPKSRSMSSNVQKAKWECCFSIEPGQHIWCYVLINRSAKILGGYWWSNLLACYCCGYCWFNGVLMPTNFDWLPDFFIPDPSKKVGSDKSQSSTLVSSKCTGCQCKLIELTSMNCFPQTVWQSELVSDESKTIQPSHLV